ncbi:probable E3 ubiquitin-protein ligase ZFP1 isoform X2 [Elaeis guineensis]|uniref:RING-type E3 ubiquitin transferase n=1 Tax=Elaeis guineensis var. tenera TaxID=51953 RepID=A0A6I9RJY3_ELAGV|nr:probable E3 ubiquitin-protein ligase ZFP1 isoform X2 [Elaeis guineensis]
MKANTDHCYIAHMGQRNTIFMHQMLDLESEPGYSHLHPDHCILPGNILHYPSQNIHLSLSASGNVAGLDCHQFIDQNRSIYHGNQSGNTQSHHPGPNLDVGVVAHAKFYHPCILPSPSPVPQNTASANHLPPFINHQVLGISVDEHSRSNHFSQSVRGSFKRKNTEAIPGNFYHANGSASSSLSSTYLSQNSGQTHWEDSYRSGNHIGQSFFPASNAWVAPVGNNISDGGCSNWNHSYTMPGLHGRSVSSGAVEMANMSMHGYQEISPSLHPASLPYFQHAQPAQNMQVQSHSHHTRMLACPYQHPLSHMQPNSPNPSSNSLHSGSRLPFFPSNVEPIYRPSGQLVEATSAVSHENERMLTSEDRAFEELSGFFGARNIIDDHRDMQLDIDGMSYEELLALEEQIGDVNTGLTDEFILKNLKTIMHVPQMSSLPDQSLRFPPENEACIICQVEYEEEERIGILDCGHNYHADCIKQWLLVKNLCPICKASALTTDKIDG